jgi:hypothetical protein
LEATKDKIRQCVKGLDMLGRDGKGWEGMGRDGKGREGKGRDRKMGVALHLRLHDDVPLANCQDHHKHDLRKGIWPYALILTTEALIY